MSLLPRLLARSLLQDLQQPLSFINLTRPLTIKLQPHAKETDTGHDEKNMKLGRPQSPHLTIYSIQLTSCLSISHRFTGWALSAYTIGLGCGSLMLPDTIPHYIDALAAANFGSVAIYSGKLLLTFPMCYHFWNGVRHLCWDMGQFLALKEVYFTGYLMLALTTASTIFFCTYF